MSVRRENPFGASPISIEHDGQTYSGTYRVDKELVYVTSDFGSEAARMGGSSAETIAAMVLEGLVRKRLSP